MNRTSDVGSVRSPMPLDTSTLLALVDARVSVMATNAFTLSVLEEIDGVLHAPDFEIHNARCGASGVRVKQVNLSQG